MRQERCLVGHNRHVTRDGNGLYDKRYIDKGILTIRDISNEVAELLTWSQLTRH